MSFVRSLHAVMFPGHFIERGPVVVKQHDPVIRRYHPAENRRALRRFYARDLEATGPALKRAAVAIALTESEAGGGTAFLLTLRAATAFARAQWALPGGRCDAGETQAQAALRELHEELGVGLGESEVLGVLDDYPTRSGYLITPVVVWAGHGADRAEPGGGRLRPSHRPRRDRAGRRLQLHHDSRKHAPRDPLPPWRSHIHAPTAALIYQFREVLAGRNTRVAELEQPVFAWK